MKREQKLCLAGGLLLLLGALVLGIGRIGPAPAEDGAKDGPAMIDSGDFRGRHTTRAAGSKTSRQMPLAGGTESGREPQDGLAPEDTPEFFATLVEEARPVLADQLRQTVVRAHQRVVERELGTMQSDGQLTREQADSLRLQLRDRFAARVTADVEAAKDGPDSISDVWNDTLARADEWVTETRHAAGRLTLPTDPFPPQRSHHEDYRRY